MRIVEETVLLQATAKEWRQQRERLLRNHAPGSLVSCIDDFLFDYQEDAYGILQGTPMPDGRVINISLPRYACENWGII